MIFIAIIDKNKKFEIIKKEILKNINDRKMNIINVNNQNIDNIKNIKFETVVIGNNAEKIITHKDLIEKICENAKYLIIDSDNEIELNFLENKEINIITYGLNHKATLTLSSRNENSLLVALQRNIRNVENQVIEAKEMNIILEESNKLNIEEVLIITIITLLYNKNNT